MWFSCVIVNDLNDVLPIYFNCVNVNDFVPVRFNCAIVSDRQY